MPLVPLTLALIAILPLLQLALGLTILMVPELDIWLPDCPTTEYVAVLYVLQLSSQQLELGVEYSTLNMLTLAPEFVERSFTKSFMLMLSPNPKLYFQFPFSSTLFHHPVY